jgi:hypothetical protein
MNAPHNVPGENKPKPRLLDQVRETIRVKHYSPRTMFNRRRREGQPDRWSQTPLDCNTLFADCGALSTNRSGCMEPIEDPFPEQFRVSDAARPRHRANRASVIRWQMNRDVRVSFEDTFAHFLEFGLEFSDVASVPEVGQLLDGVGLRQA